MSLKVLFYHGGDYFNATDTYNGKVDNKLSCLLITDLYLICLHPENKNKSYLKIKVLDLQPEIKNLFEYRKKQHGVFRKNE